jgi:hypothetical protein
MVVAATTGRVRVGDRDLSISEWREAYPDDFRRACAAVVAAARVDGGTGGDSGGVPTALLAAVLSLGSAPISTLMPVPSFAAAGAPTTVPACPRARVRNVVADAAGRAGKIGQQQSLPEAHRSVLGGFNRSSQHLRSREAGHGKTTVLEDGGHGEAGDAVAGRSPVRRREHRQQSAKRLAAAVGEG